ncbi:MAG: hypothetical protein KDK10_07145 [Maritimibacter sp.]|nr:hypothetical protein [Maritimibacter sp.]
MDRVFDRFARDEKGNAALDWGVLLTGLFLVASSMMMSLADTPDKFTDSTMDRVESLEDWLPS